MATAAPNSIESVGHLSARAGVPLSRVQRTIKALGVKPALIVDDVVFVAEDDAQRVVERLAARHQQ